MSSPGIDYSLGRSNFDSETGIHYGVISMHSVDPDACDDFENDYGKPHCPDCGNEVLASDTNDLFEHYEYDMDEDGTPEWFDGKDFTCLACGKCYWSDYVYSDEPLGWSYDQHGYALTDCLQSDIFVLKSPYYTYAQYCSPCVPGAGNLDSPYAGNKATAGLSGFPKVYALGHEYFENDKAPYPVYRISDGTEVLPEE